MIYLADHFGKSPVFLKDVAKGEEISEKYLSLIVIPLRSGCLIESTRGAHGGYSLSRRPEKITVHDIFKALEGKICLVDCVKNSRDCSRVAGCPSRDVWSMLGDMISETLSSITLASLVKLRRDKAENNIMDNI
jgi:Rrf2 family cysteine metabolism transcriptional repressor